MNYNLIKNVIDLVEEFEHEKSKKTKSALTVDDFKDWIVRNYKSGTSICEPNWEGKEKGRSAESVINTLIVHMNRYAKSYSKSVIFGSEFASQEDYIYLINLRAFGEMTKMDLIKKNVHEKPAGMKVISRLIAKNWVHQTGSQTDKRSKVLKITEKGLLALEAQMKKIRKATEIVTGDLSQSEKLELIRILSKLNDFHKVIYERNIEPEHLLDNALIES